MNAACTRSIVFTALAILSGTASLAQARAVISVDTSRTLPVPSRNNFSGANMQIFYTGSSYLDTKMQEMTQGLNLGWVRFPAGTVDDVYDWKTGDMREDWIKQFQGSKTEAYSNFIKDFPIVRGKGFMKLDDFATYVATQTDGKGPNASPTQVIGVINTFTDTPESAAALVLAAKNKKLPVYIWELGNEPVYFDKFYPTPKAYLDSVAPFAAAIKKADPTARVAVYIDRKDGWVDGIAAYKNRYWDELYLHAYPSPPKDTTDAEGISFYNGFLAAMTNRFVDRDLQALFSPAMKMEISEFNIGALRGGMYAGVFIAEYTLRLSSDPHVTRIGMHTLVGRGSERDAAILPADDHVEQVLNAYRAGKKIDTSQEDFGYFYTPDGLALQVIDGVINTSEGLWPTLVAGGDSVTTAPIGMIAVPGKIPALYAQAFRSAGGKTIHLLITNKSSAPQMAAIAVNGKTVKGPFSTVAVGASDPLAKNTSAAPETVRLQRDTVGNAVLVPAYSVMDVSWRN
jgi:hypothetical protein